jgi:Domain of unknown function (DUF4129)
MDGRRRTWDGRAGAAAGLCLIGLAAVVAATSRAGAHGGGGAVHIGSTAGHALTAVLLTAGFLVWIAATTVLVRALWPAAIRRRKRDPEDDVFEPYRPEVRWWEKAIVLALPLLVIAGALAAVILTGRTGATRPETTLGNPFGGTPGARSAAAHPAPAATSAPTLAIALAAAVAIAVVVAAALFLIRRRTRPARATAPPPSDHELAAALDWSLDDLRSEPDPRRAVIAAYARMERLLGERGVGRHRWEAPLEYLGRALARLRGGERSMAELTSLFQEARFGPHAIGEPHRARAVRLLTALRRELDE